MKKTIDDGESSQHQSEKQLRSLLAPLEKAQLLDLLANLGTKIPEAAEEIRGVMNTQACHRKLFVHGFSTATTSETLCAAFSPYGEIEEGTVTFNMATGKSRCFGFVTFKNMESTQKALKSSIIRIDGSVASYSLATEGLGPVPRTASITLRKLYVGGLSDDTTTGMLVSFFEQYGEIEEAAVIYDRKTNESRRFGFVTYLKAMDAKKAFVDPDKIIRGKKIIVRHAFPQHESSTYAS